MERRLTIRLLGELELCLDGERLALPPSKKTRALLGYLVLSDRSHRRDRLCALLWDVADDPRAALRWSLSKLRELVDRAGRPRLIADRDAVRLDLEGVLVDVAEARALLGRTLAEVSTEALEEALALFRGELLEGLELPDFHAYYAFCLSEREALRGLQLRLVSELLARFKEQPERALPHARRLVELDPTSESARAEFFALLHASGRAREVAAESQKTIRLFERAAALAPPDEGESGRASRVPEERRSELAEPLVGRSSELARLRAFVGDARPFARALLIVGEAGVGKSRLLRQSVRDAAGAGLVREGAAYEVDAGFAYAPFRALLAESGALAQAEHAGGTPAARADLSLLRDQLFQRVAEWLATKQSDGPVLLALEDLHWFDEGSAQLLHYLISASQGMLRLLLTARSGELSDNAPVRRVLRALRSAGVLEELALGPLSAAEIGALVRTLGASADPAQIHAESAGNPLFAIELARASGRRTEGVPASLTRLVRERMESLGAEHVELVRWAAVLGERFRSEELAGLMALEPGALVDALEQLERLGWLCFEAGETVRFSHAIVHRAIYDGLSDPRRRLMHARVAHQLERAGSTDGLVVASLARHAALGGDAEMAVKACVLAGERCLRLFAVSDATALARRGLAYVAALPLPARVLREIELREIAVMARRPEADDDLHGRLAELASEALSLSEIDHARRAFFLQAFLRWEEGNSIDARHFSREAERCSRLGGSRERLRALGDTARCLCFLERDLTEAQAFVLEAEALVSAGEPETASVTVARGMLELWRGEHALAEQALARALALARQEGDRLLEFLALEFAVESAMTQGEWARAATLAEALVAQSARCREGSETPYAEAVRALVARVLGRGETGALEAALSALRAADAKQRMAYVLVRAAEQLLALGEADKARRMAEEGLALAELMESATEEALSRAVLLQHAFRSGEPVGPAQAALAAFAERPLSMRGRKAIAAALAATSTKARPAQRGEEAHGTRDRRARLRGAGGSRRDRAED